MPDSRQVLVDETCEQFPVCFEVAISSQSSPSVKAVAVAHMPRVLVPWMSTITAHFIPSRFQRFQRMTLSPSVAADLGGHHRALPVGRDGSTSQFHVRSAQL
jgi:hypothetical protein